MAAIRLVPVMLVTGATGSIGFEIAAQAATAGTTVGVHGVGTGSVAAWIERLRGRVPGATFHAMAADFREEGTAEGVIARMVAGTGRIVAIVHRAITGVPGTSGAFLRTDPASYGRRGAARGHADLRGCTRAPDSVCAAPPTSRPSCCSNVALAQRTSPGRSSASTAA